MRCGLCVPAIVMLSACGSAEQPDICETALEALDTCLVVNREVTAFETLQQCVPLSELQSIEGTWAFDYDLNAFYEGEQLDAETARDTSRTSTQLVYHGSQLEEWVVGELATVAEISFYGRRPECGLDERFPYLVVERVASRDVIEQAKSDRFPEPDWEPSNYGHADPFDRTEEAP